MALWKTGMTCICPNCPAASTKKRGCESVDQWVQAQVVPAVPRLWVSQRTCAQQACLRAEGGGTIATQTCRRFHAVVYPSAIHSSVPERI